MARVLYISYDGVLEPLGQSQVIAYLEVLARENAIHLISFEKTRDARDTRRMKPMRQRLEVAGISWTPLAYHKTPTVPATAWDITVGTVTAACIAVRSQAQIVHARSYVPALMAAGVKWLTGARFLFDMRGFWADERVDGGLWRKDGQLYRIVKSLEKHFLLAADCVVTLTHASKREINRFEYLQNRMPAVVVIPTCANLNYFRQQPADPNRPFTFGYVGSVGTWYLFDETLRVFKAIQQRRPDARLLIVNRNEHEKIRTAANKAGIETARLELVAAEHREIPALISRMHVGAAIIKPCYSKIASAPTKLAEYLGCGVPCVGNRGVGDVEEILEGNHVGVALDGFSADDMNAAATRILALADDAATPAHCTETARRLFSLKIGVELYRSIYKDLLGEAVRVRSHLAEAKVDGA
jgi:glycosyltransferase involved in cell wall biosynthesis